jgi:ubiquitin-like 1-activating enzyme E1 B
LPIEDENGVLDLEPTPKRARTKNKIGAHTIGENATASPNKRRKLEEDGFLLVEGASDVLDDDVIEID